MDRKILWLCVAFVLALFISCGAGDKLPREHKGLVLGEALNTYKIDVLKLGDKGDQEVYIWSFFDIDEGAEMITITVENSIIVELSWEELSYKSKPREKYAKYLVKDGIETIFEDDIVLYSIKQPLFFPSSDTAPSLLDRHTLTLKSKEQ